MSATAGEMYTDSSYWNGERYSVGKVSWAMVDTTDAAE